MRQNSLSGFSNACLTAETHAEGEKIVIRFRRALDYLGDGLKSSSVGPRRPNRPENHLTLVQVKALLLLSETGGIAAAAVWAICRNPPFSAL